MSVAFAAETVVAHKKGIVTVAFAREEEKEKETEEKKSKEQQLKFFAGMLSPTALPEGHHSASSSGSAELSAGYYTKPFNPPDVI